MIFEPLLTGHRPVYVQTLITYLSELGDEVVVVLPHDGRTSKEFATVLEPLSHVAQYEFTIPKIQGEGPQRLKHVRALVRSVRKNSPTLVVVPTADYLAQWCVSLWCLAWAPQFWSTQLRVNMIALPFGYPVRSFRDVVKRLAYGVLLAIAPIRRTTTIDEINLQSSWPIVPKVTRMRYAPEPIPAKATQSKRIERERLGLSAETRLIGIVGIVDSRKASTLLLEAVKRTDWPADCRVLLAGPVDTEVSKFIEESDCADRIIVRNHYLRDDEVSSYIKCLDWVWLVYNGHQGPSATMLKALTLGTMGIAQGEGWIGKHARDNPLAVILRERSPEAVAKVLQLTQTPNKEEQAPASELMLRHSGKQFCEAVIGLI
jgi:hypothetical protein